MPRPRLRVLLGSAIAMGPGKADLLEAIEAEGSITHAAQHMGMSYRRAWLLVETMNGCFREPLVETTRGGRCGGGAQLTALGRQVLDRYRHMEAKAAKSLEPDMARFQKLLATDLSRQP